MFEELSDPCVIARQVAEIIGFEKGKQECFGLSPMAKLSTVRKSWVADGEFQIVEDRTDFGHLVGEVELLQEHTFVETSASSIEDQKHKKMQVMDRKIVDFMARYSWAFRPGTPKGKLVAYFERHLKTEWM